MITFRCLVVKPYKSYSKDDQLRLMKELKAVAVTRLLWDIEVESDLAKVKEVEGQLLNKVPYLKLKGPSELIKRPD